MNFGVPPVLSGPRTGQRNRAGTRSIGSRRGALSLVVGGAAVWMGLALGQVGLGLEPVARAGLATVAGEVLDIQADRLEVDVEGGTALLRGNVKARLGELEVDCPRVDIRYDSAPRVRWAKGSGGVEARIKGIVAKAETVEVDVNTRAVALQGGVRLTRGEGWVEATSARIDLRTSKVTLQGVKGSIPVQPPQR